MESELFYRYYDALFTAKDYSKETNTILDIGKRYGISNINHLLEIGCGTGSHTESLLPHVSQLTAVDTDSFMIEKSEEKLKGKDNVKFFHGTVSELEEENFEMAVAMFNVVTYIDNESDLLEFFKGVRSRLVQDGLFVFDCWNGIAAINDPPGSKTTDIEVNGDKLHCVLNSETDFIEQKTMLTYNLNVKNADGSEENGKMSFSQTLWTPMQIKYALQMAELEVLHFSKNFEIDVPATENDWKVMFVCRPK